MAKTKLVFKVFTVSDFLEEESWLQSMHKQGWKLVKISAPFFFRFEKVEPEDVIYKLDFTNSKESTDYLQMYEDFGWEYCGTSAGWNYFRKPQKFVDTIADGEIFSDRESKVSMVQRIMKTRIAVSLIIFFFNASLLVSFIERLNSDSTSPFSLAVKMITIFQIFILIVYVLLLVKVLKGYVKLKKELRM